MCWVSSPNERGALLDRIIRDITGQSLKSLHSDISTLTGERIEVFSLTGPVVLSPANT
ncbi:MAG: Na-translocating system protein MpsC family protein [Kiritimatiellia bacterium]